MWVLLTGGRDLVSLPHQPGTASVSRDEAPRGTDNGEGSCQQSLGSMGPWHGRGRRWPDGFGMLRGVVLGLSMGGVGVLLSMVPWH